MRSSRGNDLARAFKTLAALDLEPTGLTPRDLAPILECHHRTARRYLEAAEDENLATRVIQSGQPMRWTRRSEDDE